MGTPALQFWYDFASTYSYVAVARIERLATAAGVDVVWRPFLLGPIFAAQGWRDSPFNLYPAKGRYMWRDMERLCAREGIPFVRPTRFPRNSLLPARLALAVEPEGWCPELTRAVFHANFALDLDVSAWEVLADVVRSLGRDPAPLYERALSPANKDALKTRTEEAQRLDIFGAPSFVAGDELFWGNDRLEQALEEAARRA